MSSKIRILLIIVTLCLFAGGVGYRLGERKTNITLSQTRGVIINQQPPPATTIDFSLFWDVWQRLFRSYIDRAELDPQKLVYGAITGMVNAVGDPYTAFFPPKENKEFKADLGGEFEGIGAQLGIKDNTIIVIAPLKGNPAEKAGIRAGDYILKVNAEPTTGWSVPQAVEKIRGPKGTKVTLSILHEKEAKPIDITLTRDTILVPSVEVWVKAAREITETKGTGRIAYLRLSRFGDRTNGEWEQAIAQIEKAQAAGNLEGMVFDLRNNPGGYLDGAVYIASEFLALGRVIVSQVNSDGSTYEYKVTRRGRLIDIPLVVLINRGSASASEIVAGALQDQRRAKLVGETSFGKGSVQTPEDLPGGAGVHITTGKWLVPSGASINQKGITPDIALVQDEALQATSDGQLAKAVELLLQ